MSYIEVREVQTSDAWTANDHDILKRNFEANPPHIVTAKGDLPVGIGENRVGVLPIGSQGQMLVNSPDSGGKAWANSGLVPIGGILIWSGSVGSIPAGWALCDGSDDTPDLRGRFVYGSGSPGTTGGAETVDLEHTHEANTTSGASGTHTHTQGDTGSGTHAHPLSASAPSSTPSGANVNVGTSSASVQFASGAHTHTFYFSTNDAGSHSHTNPAFAAGGDHTHGITAGQETDAALSATQTLLPPHYALCFIQRKL